MKVNIEFDSDDLNDPAAREELLYSFCEMFSKLKAWKDLYYNVLDHDQWLRNKLKHCDITDEEDRIYQECRDKLWEDVDVGSID